MLKAIQKESKENATYESNIGLNVDPSKPLQDKEKLDLTIIKTVDLAKAAVVLKDCEELFGNELNRPMLSHPTFSENNYYNFIIFDTETTTIGKSAEIIQIAATTDEGVFSEYIQPKTRITQAASNVHGITSSLIKLHPSCSRMVNN